MLGPGNQEAAKEALKAWPGGLQIGGGITAENAAQWIEWGADKVCPRKLGTAIWPLRNAAGDHHIISLSKCNFFKKSITRNARGSGR
jgi:hypothetical protein